MKVLNNIFIETHGIHQLLKKHFETLEAERYRNAMLSDSLDSKANAQTIEKITDGILQNPQIQALKSNNISDSSANEDYSDDLISSALDFVSSGKKRKAGKGFDRTVKRIGIKLGGKKGGRIAQSMVRGSRYF